MLYWKDNWVPSVVNEKRPATMYITVKFQNSGGGMEGKLLELERKKDIYKESE